MATFLELFKPIKKGDFGLTEEAIYKSIQAGTPFIPLWGGNKEHDIIERMVSIKGKTKSGDPITVFDGEGIVISLDGSAGNMTYKNNQKFALNHHAGFFTLKDSAKIIPEYFVLFYQTKLQNESVSEGSKTLTLDQIYSIDFDIPSYTVQLDVMELIRPIHQKKKEIEKLLNHICSIKNKFIEYNYRHNQVCQIPINQLLDCMSGNSGLIEMEIYQKIQFSGKKYTVLSSSTEESTRLGKIPLCEIKGKKIKVFEEKEGLLVIRNGKAGTTIYLNKGNYTITDHAYILSVKDTCAYKISLKWLSIQYRQLFLDYVFGPDNATWNMGGFFENVLIDVPDYDEQIFIVNEYEKIEDYEKKLKIILNKIQHIFTKTIE